METGVNRLLADAGVSLTAGSRSYRPTVSLEGFEAKVLKPQNVVEMLHLGSRDIGFAGKDWVEELSVDVVELLDTGLDPVRLVAAAPPRTSERAALCGKPIVVASEYENLARSWIASQPFEATFVRSYGATEVFPPEDADIIVDNTATGSTLRENGLEIVDILMESSTRLYANPAALELPDKRNAIERLVLLLQSVLDARKRVMLEANASVDCIERLVAILPCMREPTISPLHGESGFAVKVAVPRAELPNLIPKIKAAGGTDIVVSELAQIVP
jgi:ATP phosphoribosyltransferase